MQTTYEPYDEESHQKPSNGFSGGTLKVGPGIVVFTGHVKNRALGVTIKVPYRNIFGLRRWRILEGELDPSSTIEFHDSLDPEPGDEYWNAPLAEGEQVVEDDQVNWTMDE